jgi:outer membrane protein assembly factor BamE (lipoprotein component of BamABCDE complex)
MYSHNHQAFTSRKRTTVIVSTVLGCILFLAAYSSVVDHSFREREFNSMIWKQGGVRIRGEMVRSLQGKSVLLGMSKGQVVTLLGNPDEDESVQFRYRVDVGRRVAWKPFLVNLCVGFDEQMRVSSAAMVD